MVIKMKGRTLRKIGIAYPKLYFLTEPSTIVFNVICEAMCSDKDDFERRIPLKSKWQDIALIFTLMIVAVVSILLNFDAFFWGNPPNVYGTVASCIYLVFWFFFIFAVRKKKKLLSFSIFWSLATLFCALISIFSAVSLFFALDLFVPMCTIVLAPFSGLDAFFPSPSVRTAEYIVIALLSLAWLFESILFRKRLTRQVQSQE